MLKKMDGFSKIPADRLILGDSYFALYIQEKGIGYRFGQHRETHTTMHNRFVGWLIDVSMKLGRK
jgi:hypothetical protein